MIMTVAPLASITSDIQQLVFDAARILLYPVLVGLLVCLVWVLIELGAFLYEAVVRFRSRDMDALEVSALRARRAFADGKPRAAYRHLQENTYSIVVTRFLFDLIRNYQTERLAAKPLKLLQEYEFYTVRRLERTRILTRIGPVLGLMGALIPLAPALAGLAQGDVVELTDNLEIAFSVAVIGLLIGGLAYVIGLLRDRMYSQDISDMEYLLELLEGNAERLEAGRRRDRLGRWESDPFVTYVDVPDTTGDTEAIEPVEPTEEPEAVAPTGQAVAPGTTLDEPGTPATPAASFDDPDMSWHTDDDPFAALGPAEASQGPARLADDSPRTRASGPDDVRDTT
jgi:biopolymer transport protein ExbB/TolQ